MISVAVVIRKLSGKLLWSFAFLHLLSSGPPGSHSSKSVLCIYTLLGPGCSQLTQILALPSGWGKMKTDQHLRQRQDSTSIQIKLLREPSKTLRIQPGGGFFSFEFPNRHPYGLTSRLRNYLLFCWKESCYRGAFSVDTWSRSQGTGAERKPDTAGGFTVLNCGYNLSFFLFNQLLVPE